MTEEKNRPCNQCGAEPGERHRGWDDIARCAVSGVQGIQCRNDQIDDIHPIDLAEYDDDIEAYFEAYEPFHSGPCRPDVWDGEYPGVKKCRELGWYVERKSFLTGEMEVTEDLNRLYSSGQLRWDSELEDFVLR